MQIEEMNMPQLREALRAKTKQVGVLRAALGECMVMAISFGPKEGETGYPAFKDELENLNKIYLENM